jgi:hypothetical protein
MAAKDGCCGYMGEDLAAKDGCCRNKGGDLAAKDSCCGDEGLEFPEGGCEEGAEVVVEHVVPLEAEVAV